MKARDGTDRTERPKNQGEGMGKRTRIIIILCAVVVLAGAIAAIVVLNQRHQDAEQVKRQAAALASQKKAAENFASELDLVATDYTDTVDEIESALAGNASVVNAWKKELTKRQTAYKKKMAAYRTKVAAVNAYNSSRWVPNVRTTYYEPSRPGFLLYQEPSIPSGNVEYIDGFECDGVIIDKILTWRASRPKGPRRQPPPRPAKLKAPSKIPDPVAWYPSNTLARLETRLDILTAELDSAKLGPQFLPVADDIGKAIEILRTDVELAQNACFEVVRRDRRMGYVAVHKKLEGVDVRGVGEAVQALSLIHI